MAQKDKYFAGGFSLFFSAYLNSQLKNNNLPEIAFFGRSNVGKSSLLNVLCNSKNLAKTSKTPGCTASINFFINKAKNLLLVDLPGYGFAATKKKNKNDWGKLMMKYLQDKQNIKISFILIDSRRGVMDSDLEMIDMLDQLEIPHQIILTKCDKLTSQEVENIYNEVQVSLADDESFKGQIFKVSSSKKIGIEELKKYIATV